MIRPIHPFPARMAPELAIAALKELKGKGVVLDPMSGSGMVVRHASELGHSAVALDFDPLSVLMTRVWTTPVNDLVIERLMTEVMSAARELRGRQFLGWIDEDEETKGFVEYWFAKPQRASLRRVAYVLRGLGRLRLEEKRAAADVLRLALSRIIITKDRGASLARDVSHSRPHRTAKISDFEVVPAFERSVRQLRQLLISAPPRGNVDVRFGDARSLDSIESNSIDAVLTSPPYLNAIDYMRGHKLSLVWLGYRVSDLRLIRSNSIGAERGPNGESEKTAKSISQAMAPMDELPRRYSSMVARYAEDIFRVMSEVARVLKPHGKAILVVGNSCLKEVFIRNSDGIVEAASIVGLKRLQEVERELPIRSRYLPMPEGAEGPLGKRMRTETILTFAHA